MWNYIRKILGAHSSDWLVCLYNNHRLVEPEVCAVRSFAAWVMIKIS